jgi:hypothetical protein
VDKRWGNHKLDAGLASGVCQIRREEWCGIAGPNILKQSHLPTVKKVHRFLYDILPHATPSWFEGKLYYCPRRAALFSVGDCVPAMKGTHIQSFRMALSWKYSELAIHRDANNDNSSPTFSPVVVSSLLLNLEGKMVRLALITYSRKFVADTMAKIERYGPCIKHISNFYSRMKTLGRADVSNGIFQQDYKREGKGKLVAARIKPHMNTCIHFSAMGADALLKLNRKYKLSQQQAMALIYSVTACNSPDYFRLITNRMLQDDKFGKDFLGHGPGRLACEVYEMIFALKRDGSRGKQKLPGQRHQPCGNKQGSREAITNSVRNMIDKCHQLSCYQDTNKSLRCKQHIKTLYLSTLRDFCKPQSKGGVYGAGPLIADKNIQIAALWSVCFLSRCSSNHELQHLPARTSICGMCSGWMT